MITGTLLADGINGPGLEPAAARSIIQSDQGTSTPLRAREVYNGYGCNMSVRLAGVLEERVLFDENLPLYGWLEDVDLRRLVHMGKIVRLDGARGVHLGVKSGRTNWCPPGIFSDSQSALHDSARNTVSSTGARADHA